MDWARSQVRGTGEEYQDQTEKESLTLIQKNHQANVKSCVESMSTPPTIHPLGNQPLGRGRGHLFTFLAFSPFSLSTEHSEGLLFARRVTPTLQKHSFFWACTVQHGSPHHLWLLDFKFIKDENTKNPVARFPEPHFQESTATCGQWLPHWTAFITMESPIGRRWSRKR